MYVNIDIEAKLISAIEKLSNVFKSLLWDQGKKHGLTSLQLQVLMYLNKHKLDHCKPIILAKEFCLTKPTISETIRILKRKKLIQQKKDDKDMRGYFIVITSEGRELIKKIEEFTESFKVVFFNSLSNEDKETLFFQLLNVIHQLNKQGIIYPQRICFTCEYYKNFKNAHYCRLLHKFLGTAELQIDCIDHKLKE
jgi:DNA-binding MarR family transcriptional regulator